jgi:hypothetical protein
LSNPVISFRAAKATAIRISDLWTAKPSGHSSAIREPGSVNRGLVIPEKLSRTMSAVLTILILFGLVHATPSAGM